jgi:hypothetical protein
VREQAVLIVASPPYAETPIAQTHMTSDKRGDPDNPNYRPSWKRKLAEGFAGTERPYGYTPGQLGRMKDMSKHTEKATVGEVPSDAWTSCYDGGWQGLIVAEAFAHP